MKLQSLAASIICVGTIPFATGRLTGSGGSNSNSHQYQRQTTQAVQYHPGHNSQPPEIQSKNGFLKVNLDVDLVYTPDLDRMAPGFNGGPVGPTLRAKPGDKVRITLTNNLDPSTEEELANEAFVMSQVDDSQLNNQTILANRLTPEGNLWSLPREEYWGHAFQNIHFHGVMVDPVIGTCPVYIEALLVESVLIHLIMN